MVKGGYLIKLRHRKTFSFHQWNIRQKWLKNLFKNMESVRVNMAPYHWKSSNCWLPFFSVKTIFNWIFFSFCKRTCESVSLNYPYPSTALTRNVRLIACDNCIMFCKGSVKNCSIFNVLFVIKWLHLCYPTRHWEKASERFSACRCFCQLVLQLDRFCYHSCRHIQTVMNHNSRWLFSSLQFSKLLDTDYVKCFRENKCLRNWFSPV